MMEQMFKQFEEENQRLLILQEASERSTQTICEEIHELQAPLPKIRKVPHYLRNRVDFAKHYSPKLVSFGPIHHGDQNLKLGEEYKRMWSVMYVRTRGQTARDLHKRVLSNIKELQDLFDKDLFAKQEFTKCEFEGFKDLDEKLSWMLFVDGCALLQVLENGNLGDACNYCHLKIKMDQLILVQQDVLLLENQLPFQLLRLLCCDPNANVNTNVDDHLVKSTEKFLCTHHLWPKPCPPRKEGPRPKPNSVNLPQQESTKVVITPPVHLLDYLRKTIVEDDGCQKKLSKSDASVKQCIITHRNIQELTASGIHLKKLDSRNPKYIKFSSGGIFSFRGILELPEITVDDTTAPTFLNLIAYEMCPDFPNDYGISSFVAFLDSLIDQPEDVKKLRSAGIMRNALGSDEEVSKLFNALSQDLVTSIESYSHVSKDIESHYKNKWLSWMTEIWNNHFSTPVAIIALLAGIIALVLTFIQTWYSVKQGSDNQSQ
ncbi:hypothetical protein HN51_022278 [Arachis hypogaea]|uniref:Uncharacterized protein n=1 Tax=Arachis hypogaea TaxID=3818 RepID=A0A445ED70_ARAHY|nr:UPF0481 protein At3g47200 [Arachis hypogaea]RYR73446.1 hypothetical protein Ahy_A02g007795 [Arachis hypogaea]